MESVIAAVVIVGLVVILIARTAIVVPQQSAYVIENLGKYSRTLAGRLPHPDPVRREGGLPAHPEGAAIDIPEQICITRDNVQVGVDGVLYLQGARPAPRLLRHHELRCSRSRSSRRRRCAARWARSTSTAPSRSAPRSTPRWSTSSTRPREPWGVKVLRYEIKNINPPADVLRGDGEADARRAREARRHPRLGGRARRQDQPGRGPEAARHQGVRGHEAAADQRGRGRGRGDPRGGDRHRRGAAPHRRGAARSPAATRPCGCASPSSTSSSSASSRRRATPSWCRRTSPTSAR